MKKFINYYKKKKQGNNNFSCSSIDNYSIVINVDEKTNAIGMRIINIDTVINSSSPPSNIQVIVMLEKLKFELLKNFSEDIQDEKFNLKILPKEKENANLWIKFYNEFCELKKEENNNGN